MSPRLDTEAEQADSYLRERMGALRIPGMQVAVVRGGRTAFLRSYGTASLELSVPVTDQTVFAVNSIAKALSGVAAMAQVSAGRLELAAPVSAYLDGLPTAWQGVTIRQLLSHTSGLPDVIRAPTVETNQDAAWEWVQGQPVYFAPGERFNYSQTNYTLIQRVINRINGAAPDTPLGGPQFEAAGMTRTHYGDASDVIAGKAPSYRYTFATPGSPGELRVAVERFLPFRRASSGLNSSAEDMARWLLALQQGRILDKKSLETLWTPVAFNSGKVGQWALGWQILQRRNHRAVGMTGGGRAAFYYYPEHDVAVVILTNLAGSFPEDLIDKVASIFAPSLHLTGIPALRIALDEQGYGRATAVAAELAAKDPSLRWSELELNDWGYRLLSSGRPEEGLEVLKLVVGLFPNSANAYDSVAEAYAANGEKALALANYRRALELDPTNSHAQKRIEQLER